MTKSQIEKIEDKINKLKEKLIIEKQNQTLECPSCKSIEPIKNMVLIVREFYVPPRGCMEGDYWTEGKIPDFYVVCSHCKKMNRYYDEETDTYKFVNKYRNYFKVTVFQTEETNDVILTKALNYNECKKEMEDINF